MHGLIDINGLSRLFPIERFIRVIDELINTALEYKIRLTLENVSWCILNCPDIAKKLVSVLDEKLHYTLDIKQCLRSGYTPADYISVLGKQITNVHLCDYTIDNDGKYHWKLPGEGSFDYEAFFIQLRDIGYAGP